MRIGNLFRTLTKPLQRFSWRAYFNQTIETRLIWISVLAGLVIVIDRWLVYYFAVDYWTILLIIRPVMVGGCLLLAVLIRKANLKFPLQGILGILLVYIMLFHMPPILSKKVAMSTSEHIAITLGFKGSVTGVRYQLERGIGDIGLPPHIFTSYTISESPDLVAQKLSHHLTETQGWYQSTETDSLVYYCSTPTGLSNYISLKGDQLNIFLFFHDLGSCAL